MAHNGPAMSSAGARYMQWPIIFLRCDS